MKLLLLTLLSLTSLAFAEGGQKRLRILPLGSYPDWERYDDGIHCGVALPPGVLPPSPLATLSGKEAGKPWNPRFGSFSEFFSLEPEAAQLELFEESSSIWKPWLTAPAPTFKVALGVLLQDPGEKAWLKPSIRYFDDSAESFPTGNIRFINVSEQNVLVMVGKSKAQRILPGDSLMLPVMEGENRLRVGFENKADNDKPELLFQNVIRVAKGQRIQTFIYKDQRNKPGNKPRFLWKPEPLPSP